MECYLNRLLKLFKIVLGPYRIRSSCNHPAARITPLSRSPTMLPYNFDSPRVFSHRFVQISSGLSTDDRLMFVPGIVRFSVSCLLCNVARIEFAGSAVKLCDKRLCNQFCPLFSSPLPGYSAGKAWLDFCQNNAKR